MFSYQRDIVTGNELQVLAFEEKRESMGATDISTKAMSHKADILV